jgi:hypothetical protein
MSTPPRFTDDEKFLLFNTPAMIGAAMSFAQGSGAIGTFKEALANAKTISGGVKQYPNNDVIQSVLPDLENRESAMATAKVMRSKAVERMKALEIDSKEKMHAQAIEDIGAVRKLLDEKASPEEAAEYREWALSVAENVAKAASEGGFLGFGGERISEGEKKAYAEIAGALGVDARLA